MYGPPYAMNPDVNLVRQLLSIGKILALILAILGVIGIVLSVLAILAFQSFWGYAAPGSFYVGPVYDGIMAVVGLLWWMQAGPIERQFQAGQYAQVRERLVIWMILTLIFGVIVGILLIIAYVKLDQLSRGGMPQPPMGAPGPAYMPPMGQPSYMSSPPSAAAPSPQPSTQSWSTPSLPQTAPPAPMPTAAPSVPTCPKCGRPATWIAQYSRWYCYTDAQYL